MKKRNSIEIFSTSAIDLLACGLALAAVLWVLEMPNNGFAGEGESSHFDAFLRIQQFGIFHFQGIEINGNGTKWEANYNRKKNTFVQQNIEGFNSNITKGPTIPLTFTNPDNTPAKVTISVRKSEHFAGEMSVRFEGVVGDLNVQFRVRPCNSSVEVHYLEIFKVDRTGISRPQYLWQCEDKLESALKKKLSSAPKWLKAYHKGLNGNFTFWHRPKMEIHTWDRNECYHGQNLSIKLTGDGRFVQQTYDNPSREQDDSKFWKELEYFAKRPI